MIRHLPILLRGRRAATAALLLGVLALGGALHGLHHLQDPACADGVGRDGHACTVCASLHASTLAPRRITAPVPVVAVWAPVAPTPVDAPALRAHAAAPPRAPPAS